MQLAWMQPLWVLIFCEMQNDDRPPPLWLSEIICWQLYCSAPPPEHAFCRPHLCSDRLHHGNACRSHHCQSSAVATLLTAHGHATVHPSPTHSILSSITTPSVSLLSCLFYTFPKPTATNLFTTILIRMRHRKTLFQKIISLSAYVGR